jgi:ribose/xylose/arabinose/galactoside ABC-type transport system permease subunit
LTLYGGLVVPHFATETNVTNILRNIAPVGITSLGQTLVIASGGLDLSVGMLMGLVTVLSNGLMNGNADLLPVAVVLAVAVGLTVGLVNGVVITATGINPMILTFGMLSVLEGIIFLYTDRSIGLAPEIFRKLDAGSVGPLPVSFLLLAGLTAAAWLVLSGTPFGRYVCAIGGDEGNARKAGIPTKKVSILVYTISGLSAAIGGLVLAARLGSGYPLAGRGLELDAIVAVVIGGTSFSGGKGRILGTVGGVLVLALISNILNLLQISPYVQQVTKGLIVVAAVALYATRRSGR